MAGPHTTVADAAAIARAVAAYDQQGCVSPHAVYVQAGGVDAMELAAAIARELEVLAESLPARRLNAAEAIAIRGARDRAEFRSIAGNAQRVFVAPMSAIKSKGAPLGVQVRNARALELRDHVLEHQFALLEPLQHELVYVRVRHQPRDDLIEVPMLHAQLLEPLHVPEDLSFYFVGH